MTELVCIVCPKGCHLRVDEQNGYRVTGNDCPRGEEYGKKELTNPTRVVTSTVAITGASINRLPVKTDRDIPKKDMMRTMQLLSAVSVSAPIRTGDVILNNILGLGINIVATRDVERA